MGYNGRRDIGRGCARAGGISVKIQWNRRDTTRAVYSFLVVAAAILFYFALQNITELRAFANTAVITLQPFIFGFVIAYLLNPVYVFLQRRFLPWLTDHTINPPACRGMAILLTYLFAGGVLFLFFRLVIPQILVSIASIFANLQNYAASLQQVLDFLMELIAVDGLPQEVIDAVNLSVESAVTQAYDLAVSALPKALEYAMNFTSGVFNLVIGIIISIYMFMGKERFLAQMRKVMYAFFSEEHARFLLELARESNAIFSGFITGKIIDSAIIGVLCFIGMSLLDMPYVMLVSVIVGVTNVIPYFGPFIGAIPSFVIVLTEDPIQALVFLVFIFLLQQFDGNILGPKILGDTTGLSAFWVVFAILIFAKLLGFAGMFIGVPVFAVIYSVVKKFVALRLEARGLSSETASYADDPADL